MYLANRSKYVLAVLFLALFCGQAYSLTLQEVVRRTRQYIGDEPYRTPLPRISDSNIKDLVNEGQDYFSAQWVFTNRSSVTIQGGTTEYFMPSDYIATKRVQYKDRIIPESTLQGMDGEGRSWPTSSGVPNTYYTRTTTLTVIGFYPAPNASSSGTVTIDYYAVAATLSNSYDVPFNGIPEYRVLHDSLAKYAAYRFYLSEGNLQMADVYAKEVLADITRLKAIVETKPNYRPGLSVIEKTVR